MSINDAIIKANFKGIFIEGGYTGFWDIDIEKAIKEFDKKCLIFQWGDDFRLMRIVYKHKKTCNVNISRSVAKKLIEKLRLRAMPKLFYSGTIYRLCELERRGNEV